MKQHGIPKKIKVDLEKMGLTIEEDTALGEVRIGSVIFKTEPHPDAIDSLPINQGLILNDSNIERRRSLENKEINFIDHDGNISFKTGDLKLNIQKIKKIKKRTPQKTSEPGTRISTTLLVSPNSFTIIDSLFRIKESELKKFKSGLSFCKSYSLDQPKLSKIMTNLNAENLIELKRKIKKIPLDWWLYAFDNPITKRKMTPFFQTAQIYFCADPKFNLVETAEILKQVKEKYPNQVCEGPTTVAEYYSELVEHQISLWVSQFCANELKKTFKLIPGIKDNHKLWRLAVTPSEMKKTEIISHCPTLDLPSSNIMRAAWDLSFADARSREVRANLLRRFLK
jgi:hypothetical protein